MAKAARTGSFLLAQRNTPLSRFAVNILLPGCLLVPASISCAQISSKGLYFDGTQQLVTVTNYYNGIDTGDFAIEAWIRDDMFNPGFPTEEPILDNRENSTGPMLGFRLAITNGQLTFFAGLFGTSCGPDLRDQQCHHVAVSRIGGNLSYYVDGILSGGDFNDGSLLSDAPELYIGAKLSYPSGVFPFYGLIKEVRIWNKARTQSEIQSNMNAVVNPDPNLVSYWRMDEGSGQSVTDYSGNSHTGVLGHYSWAEIADPVWSDGCPDCPPHASISSSGTTICSGESATLYANAQTGLSYQWKKDGIDIPFANASSYVTGITGSYSVEVSNSCGDSVSPPVVVIVNPVPSASITASGSTTICKPESVTLNAEVKANRSYQWKRNGVIVPGATASSLVVTQSGYYKVIVTNTSTGCSNTTGNAVHVIAYSKPSAKITPSGIVTFCAGQSALLTANSGNNYSYQWKKDGALIPGATNQTLTVTTAGIYKVIVTKANGCSKVSKADTVVVPCRTTQQEEPNEPFPGYRVYPNPAGTFVTVDAGRPGHAEFLLLDAMQRVVLRQPFDGSMQISLGELAPGLYRYLIRRNGIPEDSGKLIRE